MFILELEVGCFRHSKGSWCATLEKYYIFITISWTEVLC